MAILILKGGGTIHKTTTGRDGEGTEAELGPDQLPATMHINHSPALVVVRLRPQTNEGGAAGGCFMPACPPPQQASVHSTVCHGPAA